MTTIITATGIVLYPQLPDQMASHWNLAGEADGFMDKIWGIFLFPTLTACFVALYAVIPKIDPLRSNIESFRPQYNLLFVGLVSFFAYLFLLSLVWNLGWRFNFSTALLPALATLLYGLGTLMAHAKQNWFIGIRTPWTLSNEHVWTATHRLGGRLFKLAAAIALASIALGGTTGFVVFLVTTTIASIVPTIYSYILYRRLESGEQQ